MVKWEKTANEFTIIQGEISPLVFIVLFLVGAIFTLIGACGMILQLLYLLVDSSLSVKVFLVMGIFSFIGMVALGIGLKLKKENLAEEIVFANKQETVFFRRHRQAQPFYQLDYADVSHIHTYMEKRHTSYSNSSSNTYIYYIIYLIKKDGAEIWLTQFISDLLSFQKLVAELADFTGWAVKDNSGQIASRKAMRQYESRFSSRLNYQPSSFLIHQQHAFGQEISLQRPHFRTGTKLMFGIGSILFILLPLNIFISLIAEKEMAGAIITGFIALVLGTIILLLILQQLKDIRLNLGPDCLELAIVFRLLPFLNKKLLIAADKIRYVRVNRVETGYFILSLGLDPKTENIDKLFKLLIALGSYGLKQISNRFIDRLQEVPLWSVDSSLKPGTGPTIGDLLHLENLLEKGLRLSEKPIQSSE